VPDVTGLSREGAEERISDAGLTPGDVSEQESEEPEGQVLGQDPAGGSEVERGTTVNLTVSTGVETVDVPNVVGLSARDARGQLRADGLAAVESTTEVTDPQQAGRVVDQRPAAGTEVEQGRQVVIIVGELVEEDVITPGDPQGGAP
jgi:eukaryotic-like serine/threonine-protein kinase